MMWSDILKFNWGPINRKFIHLENPRYDDGSSPHPQYDRHMRGRTKHDSPYIDDKGWGEHLWGLARNLPDVENRELDGIAEYESWWRLLQHLAGKDGDWSWHSDER